MLQEPPIRKKYCPDGERRNPKTGLCEPKKDREKKNITKRKNEPKEEAKKKYCPDGERRNPKTGLCEPKKRRKKECY